MTPRLRIVMLGVGLVGCATSLAAQGEPSMKALIPDYLGKGVLKGLDVGFKTFTTGDADSFGVRYQYDRAFRPLGTQSALDWLVVHPRLIGNVAFDSEVNPEDFLESKLEIGAQFSGGGTAAQAFTLAEVQRYNTLMGAAAKIESETELDEFLANDPDADWFVSTLSPQFTVDLGLVAGLESNQDFTERQATFGASMALDLDLWGESARYNLFDYPFALLRHMVDVEKTPRVTALGSTFPQLVAGLDYVTPLEGDPRSALGDETDFWRARAEINLRSPIAFVGERTVFVNCSYRVFYELDASDAVRAADQDLYQYGAVSITATGGLFVRYVSGRLPLDQSGNAFELGWSYQF